MVNREAKQPSRNVSPKQGFPPPPPIPPSAAKGGKRGDPSGAGHRGCRRHSALQAALPSSGVNLGRELILSRSRIPHRAGEWQGLVGAGRGGRDPHAVAVPCRHPDTDLHLHIAVWGFSTLRFCLFFFLLV